MKKLVLLIILLTPFYTFAEIPNTFSSGESLTSQSLNENFSALTLKSESMIKVLTNSGKLFGYVMPRLFGEGQGSLSVITEKKYVLGLYHDEDALNNGVWVADESSLIYESEDCTGQPYFLLYDTGLSKSIGLLKLNNTVWWYAPPAISYPEITAKSAKSGNGEGCFLDSGTVKGALAFTNDTLVTGFDPSELSLPLSFKFPFED